MHPERSRAVDADAGASSSTAISFAQVAALCAEQHVGHAKTYSERWNAASFPVASSAGQYSWATNLSAVPFPFPSPRPCSLQEPRQRRVSSGRSRGLSHDGLPPALPPSQSDQCGDAWPRPASAASSSAPFEWMETANPSCTACQKMRAIDGSAGVGLWKYLHTLDSSQSHPYRGHCDNRL